MSVDYCFEICTVKRVNLSSVNIVESYLKAGWSIYSERKEVIYTDVGDNDDFDFIAKHISIEEYFDIVRRKESNKELIAFVMYYLEKKHRYRMDITITPELNVLISPDDGTRKMLIGIYIEYLYL